MVKKPRANRSAPPRKPVIIEAEAQPVQKDAAPAAKPAETPSTANKPSDAKPATSTTPTKPDVAKPEAAKAASDGLSRTSAEANAEKGDKPDVKSQAIAKAASVAPTAKPDSASKSSVSTTSTAKSSDTSGNKSTSNSSSNNNGSGGAVKGGVIGALLTLLGAVGLNYAGVLPGGGTSNTSATTDISALEAKVEALSTSTATAPALDPASVQPLIDAALANQAAQFETQLTELRSQMAADVAAGGDTSTPVDLSGVETQITSLEAEITDLKASLSSGSAGEAEGLSVLSGRIEAIEGGLQTAQTSISAMGENIVATIPDDVSQTIAGLQTSVTENADKLGTLSAALETAQSETNTAIETLSANMTEQITALSGQVETIGAQAADTSRQNDVASAIATAGLKAAIDRGGSFMAELETFAQVAPDSELLAQLRPLAAKGVPTRASLLERFDAAAYDMINAETASQQGDSDGGIMSGLMSSVQSLVKVRPVGNVEGDSAAAITARMGEKLKAGDFAGIKAEYATLPDAAKAAGANFMADLEARDQADGLIRNMLDQALSATQPAAE